MAERSRARRILRLAGRRLFDGRRRRLFHLDGGGNQGGPHSRRSRSGAAPLRYQRDWRNAPQSSEERALRAGFGGGDRAAAAKELGRGSRTAGLGQEENVRGAARAAGALDLEPARHVALRSLDRILAEAWRPERGWLHVAAYSDPKAEPREVRGMLDDYAFTAIACLDAYETTADLSYFRFAKSIVDTMIDKFFDPVGGGFLDTESGSADGGKSLGVLASRRKPFQDSPTPAGNSMAAIALLRLHAYTNDPSYRDKAELTLEVFAGTAEQFGIFGSTYGIAAVYFSRPHTQVVVVGEGEEAENLRRAAARSFAFHRSVMCLNPSKVVAENLPPAFAETLPTLPKSRQACAVVCANGSCQPPVFEAPELEKLFGVSRQPAA